MTETDKVELTEDQFMLTTIDNPYNPKTHYTEWNEWDQRYGYNTESYIARLLVNENIEDYDDEFALNIAISKVINFILEQDDHEIYMLV